MHSENVFGKSEFGKKTCRAPIPGLRECFKPYTPSGILFDDSSNTHQLLGGHIEIPSYHVCDPHMYCSAPEKLFTVNNVFFTFQAFFDTVNIVVLTW